MTLSEFKAWLEGFEEAMGGKPPSADQWKAIKEKLAKVVILKSEPQKPYLRERPSPWWEVSPLITR